MKLFLDTANIDQINDAMNKGAIQGVTTNPSLLSKEPKTDFDLHIAKLVELCSSYKNGVPLSVEVFAEDPDGMIEQAKQLTEKFDYDKLNIKIPVGFEELGVIDELSSAGIRVNATCCFTATQMQLAALAGARYVSLFYCRLLDDGGDSSEVLKRVHEFIEANGLDCEIIAGSIRSPQDVENAWAAGAHIVTTGHDVVKRSTEHPKTTESIQRFLSDFESWMK
jgi:transaldolase